MLVLDHWLDRGAEVEWVEEMEEEIEGGDIEIIQVFEVNPFLLPF